MSLEQEKESTISALELRPTVLQVDLSAIEKNYQQIARKADKSKIMAIVKANAYGHGAVRCAGKLIECGVDYLGVALVEEGIELRKAGITHPILVFGGILSSQIKHFIDFDIELTASSVSKLKAIEDTARGLNKKARVQLKIDTGMERIGTHWYSAEKLFTAALKAKHIEVVGVFSHLATANEDDESFAFAYEQLDRFKEVKELFCNMSDSRPIFHIAASSAIFRLPESHMDMVRPGISLYGVYPCAALKELVQLEPAMQLRSSVVYFKVVRKGSGVSYGLSWKAAKDTRIVTVPVGYGDGYSRRLSNCGQVLIGGKRYPIVGRICMDQLMVDVGSDTVFNDAEVVLLGAQGDERITVSELADIIGTSVYEVLTATNNRVPRVYVG